MKILLAGPWLGEFGWEIMMWQARIRYLSTQKKYDKIVCITRTGHDLLYRDFADEILFLDIDGDKNGPKLNEQFHSIPSSILDKYRGNIEVVSPSSNFNFSGQKFISFHQKHCCSYDKYDLLFHCRSTKKLSTENRNWEYDKWVRLIDRFPKLKTACIGSSGESMTISGAYDLRGVPLERLASILSSSKMVIGPSSGVMHFASLCMCKHIVFTDTSIAFEGKYTNRYRYEKGWNPLGAKAIVIDEEGWRPSVETVIGYIEEEL